MRTNPHHTVQIPHDSPDRKEDKPVIKADGEGPLEAPKEIAQGEEILRLEIIMKGHIWTQQESLQGEKFITPIDKDRVCGKQKRDDVDHLDQHENNRKNPDRVSFLESNQTTLDHGDQTCQKDKTRHV